jgi:hypothetical protein
MELTVEQVYDILSAADLEDKAFTNTYSGRGMYGEQCVGFDLDDHNDIGMLSVSIVEVLGSDEGRKMVENTRTDSMGLGIIVYFPRWTCAGWEETDDDWDDDND